MSVATKAPPSEYVRVRLPSQLLYDPSRRYSPIPTKNSLDLALEAEGIYIEVDRTSPLVRQTIIPRGIKREILVDA